MSVTENDADKALTMLGECLSILGWSVIEPEIGTEIKGLIIGDEEYIKAWTELQQKRMDEGMN